jgi:hypothetical protein|tara:strand:+ start:3069 stop:3452 length:384 start_codon:yes stop_codon:yes gene_type:complete
MNPFDIWFYSNTPVDFIQQWLDTVCTHDPQAIVSLYAQDGILVGTVAETIKRGRKEIKTYFDEFVKKKPCGKIISSQEQYINGVSVVSGVYEFELDGDIVPARFTFVVAKNSDGAFEIINHHSSVFA